MRWKLLAIPIAVAIVVLAAGAAWDAGLFPSRPPEYFDSRRVLSRLIDEAAAVRPTRRSP